MKNKRKRSANQAKGKKLLISTLAIVILIIIAVVSVTLNTNSIVNKLFANKAIDANAVSQTMVPPTSQTWNFGYTGNYQSMKIPRNGVYRIQLYGAAGGREISDDSRQPGGNGSYTSGTIELRKDQVIYIYVGQKGGDATKGGYARSAWNGGGSGDWDHSDDESGGGGGGATDIRLVSGNWNDFASLKSRIMVAAGGGGGVERNAGAPGGALTSKEMNVTPGATQTSGYAFGQGENAALIYGNITVSGAGGGYYGGFCGKGYTYGQWGTGGSSFISGYEGCDAIDGNSTSNNIIHTGQSVHYSGRKFEETVMIAGDGVMPTYNGLGTMIGNSSNGYASITYIKPLKEEAAYYEEKEIEIQKGRNLSIGNRKIHYIFRNTNEFTYLRI